MIIQSKEQALFWRNDVLEQTRENQRAQAKLKREILKLYELELDGLEFDLDALHQEIREKREELDALKSDGSTLLELWREIVTLIGDSVPKEKEDRAISASPKIAVNRL